MVVATRHLVRLLLDAEGEGLAAEESAEELLPRVVAHIVDQRGPLGECHGSQVGHQVGLLHEGPAAVAALVPAVAHVGDWCGSSVLKLHCWQCSTRGLSRGSCCAAWGHSGKGMADFLTKI